MLAADAQDRIVALVEVMEPFVSRRPNPIPCHHTPTPSLCYSSPLANHILLYDCPYKEIRVIDLVWLVLLGPGLCLALAPSQLLVRSPRPVLPPI